MSNDIAINITAFNAASPELAKLQKDVEAATKGIQESAKVVSSAGSAGMRAFGRETEATGKSLREVLGPVKLLAGGLASELNPALGSMVFGASAAARELRTLPVALAGGVLPSRSRPSPLPRGWPQWASQSRPR